MFATLPRERTPFPLAMLARELLQGGRHLQERRPERDFSKNGSLIFATASLFLGGKISDNIGARAVHVRPVRGAVRYRPLATAFFDNIDIRYANRFIRTTSRIYLGVSVNNNPRSPDPREQRTAWMQYVPVPESVQQQLFIIDGTCRIRVTP